jgi:hypothetical protein
MIHHGDTEDTEKLNGVLPILAISAKMAPGVQL